MNDTVIEVQYFDACGDREYMRLTCKYCSGTAGAVFVFDGMLISNITIGNNYLQVVN